ncbi:MAG: alpha/beta hydrolase, partial [Anaerolineales bacterium]
MIGIAEINGTKFHYAISGEGHSLVLVHAGIADGRMWNDQFHVFEQHFKVLRYDRRGFGNTSMVAGSFSNHADLYELLKFLKIERAFLVGCSQGAKTVLDFSLEHPEMTAAVVLVSPALGGFIYSGELPRQANLLELAEEAGDLDQVNELELQIWVDGPRRAPKQVDSNVRELVGEMNAIALRTPEGLGGEQGLEPAAASRLAEVHAPTLIIIGDLDTPKTIATADFLTENIIGAQHVTMTGTAHLPNMEKP